MVSDCLGSDGGIPWAAHEQMPDMAACGMTPARGIVAATRYRLIRSKSLTLGWSQSAQTCKRGLIERRWREPVAHPEGFPF